MKTNNISNTRKKSKVVSIVALTILIISFIGSIVSAVILPKNEVIAAADNSTVTSLSISTENNWYYTTSASVIYHMDKKNDIIDSFNLAEQVNEKYGDIVAGSIISLTANVGSDYLFAFTSNRYLFQLDITDGMKLKGYTVINGDLGGIAEDEDYLYIISKPSYYTISKFALSDISTTIKTGFIYNLSKGSNVTLSLVFGLYVQGFEVHDGYLYIYYTSGFYKISSDLTGNDYEEVLNSAFNTKYSEMYEDAKQQLAPDQSEADINTKLLKQNAWNYVIDNSNVLDYDTDTGNVKLSYSTYKSEKYSLFYLDNWTSYGVAMDTKTGDIFTLSQDSIYKYNIDTLDDFDAGIIEASTLHRVPVTLKDVPSSKYSSALHFNKETGKAFVIYANQKVATFLDLRNEKLEFHTDLDYDIMTMIHNKDCDIVYYLYTDSINSDAGVISLKAVEVEKQIFAEAVKVLLTIFVILALASAIVFVCSFFYTKNDKFAQWFRSVLKDFKKQYILYSIILGGLTLLILFCYYPAVASIITSFFDYKRDKPTRIWNNFENYKNVFTNIYALESFKNMFIYLFFDVIFALIPPLIFAFFLTIMRSSKYSGLTRTLLFIPGIIPGIASTLLWKNGIYGMYGVLNSIIVNLFNGTPIPFVGQSSTAIWSLIFMGFPFVGSYLIFYGAMMNIPSSYYEAAELDNITVVKRFIYIDLPLILSQVKYVFILTFIGSVQNFGRTDLITGGRWGDMTPIYQMYQRMNQGNYGQASAYSTIIFIFLFFATVINMRMQTQEKDNS